MSTVKANNYYDASGGSNAQLYGVASPPNSMGFRNRILNGSMVIDQRNAGASVNPVSGQYLLDRYVTYRTQASKFTVQQNAGAITPPQGFSNYLGATSSSAYALLSTDFFVIGQHIEAFNYADLGWGTANAQTVTLSFWVRSSLTGTFGGSLINGSDNYSYPYSYTINAANTWEYKTITIAGPTSGTWEGATNGIGITLFFSLGTNSNRSAAAGSWIAAGGSGSYLSATGAVSVVGTNGATFYITGVQLEAGTVASPFERRDYGRELMMCQRYYEKSYDVGTSPGTGTTTGRVTTAGNAGATTTGYIEGYLGWKVNKRGAPTVTIYDMAGASGKCTRLSTGIGTSNNQTVATSVEGETGCSVFSSGSASGNCLQLHYTAASEL